MNHTLAELFAIVAIGTTVLGVVLAFGLLVWTSLTDFRRRGGSDDLSGRPRSLFQSSYRDTNKDGSP